MKTKTKQTTRIGAEIREMGHQAEGVQWGRGREEWGGKGTGKKKHN